MTQLKEKKSVFALGKGLTPVLLHALSWFSRMTTNQISSMSSLRGIENAFRSRRQPVFRSMRRTFVLSLVAGLAWGCGGERPTTPQDTPAEKPIAQPLGKLAANGVLPQAVVVARLRQGQTPLTGATVSFARSVSGNAANYGWTGTTDGRGQARVEIGGIQMGGYYRARALKDGIPIGSWSSIPINRGVEVRVELPVGERARVIGSTGLTPGGLPAKIAIGVVAPLTGPRIQYGVATTGGLELALEEINGSPKLGGASIAFFEEDSRGTAQGAVDAFNKLIFDDGVPVILGPSLSTEAKEAFPVAQHNQVVAFSTTSAASGLSAIGDFIFRASLSVDVLIPGGVALTREKLGYRRVALMVDSTDVFSRSSDDVLRGALTESGIDILARETFVPGDTTLADQLARISSLHPDAVFVSALSQQRIDVLIQGRRQGIPMDVPFIIPVMTVNEVRAAGDAAEGAIAFTGWIGTAATTGNQSFLESYRTKFGIEPNRWAAQSYAALHILAEAISNARSTDPRAIRDAMADITDLETILGEFSFDGNGDAVYDPIVLIVRNGKFEVFE